MILQTFIALTLVGLTPPDDPDKRLFDSLSDRLSRAMEGRRWQEAVSLTYEIIRRCRKADYVGEPSRLAGIGLFHLNQLELDSAQRAYEEVLERSRRGSRVSSEATAFHGLARVHIERGDYATALQWLDKYQTAFGSGCGNCWESRQMWCYLQRVVWRAALEPTPIAMLKLQRIIDGEFEPRGGRILNPPALLAPSSGEKPKLLVTGFTNKAGPAREPLIRPATDAFIEAASSLNMYTLIQGDNASRLLDPDDPVALPRRAREMGAVGYVVGEIVFVNPVPKTDPKLVQVCLRIMAYSSASGGLLGGAVHTENTDLTGTEVTNSVVEESARKAAIRIAEDMVSWAKADPEHLERIEEAGKDAKAAGEPDNAWMRSAATDEAHLALGEILLREGDRIRAVSHLREAARSQYGIAELARAHLRRLGVLSP